MAMFPPTLFSNMLDLMNGKQGKGTWRKNYKLACDSEMHFNIISIFSQKTKSQIGHFACSKLMEGEMVQQTAMETMEVLSTQGSPQDEQHMEVGHGDHVF